MFFVFDLVIRKNITTTATNIQRDWQEKTFFLLFRFHSQCIAIVVMLRFYRFLFSDFFTAHRHTHTHCIHRMPVKEKKRRKGEKKSQDCLPTNSHVNCRTHVYIPSYSINIRSLGVFFYYLPFLVSLSM